MKKTPVWNIMIWSISVLLAVVMLIVGGVLEWAIWIRLLVALPLLIGTGMWVMLHFLPKGKKPRGSAAFTGNQVVFQRIMRETDEATQRYLGAVKRKGWRSSTAMYERPWFLLLGTRKSGKSSLLRGSGLHFPMRYPSEKDGLFVEGASQVFWSFANEAVWIDTPGIYSEDTGRDDWQALVASLQKVRPEKPVDGMAVVVNAHEVLNADEQSIKEMARTLRARIDEVITLWGIEFPVYLIFNHTDKIPGFNEYFGDQLARAQDQIFGATLSQEQQKQLPRRVFAEEFTLLCRSLTDLRLDRLSKEPNEGSKRLICRFVIHFEGIQEKLGSLVAELFKPSSYEGKPIFRGFFFTSCYESRSEQKASVAMTFTGLSATIANHPLNPKQILASKSPSAAKPDRTAETKSMFVLPLFREIMVHDKTLVKDTQKRSRRSLVQHLVYTGIMLAAAIAVLVTMLVSRGRSAELLRPITSDMKTLQGTPESLVDQYTALDIVRRNVLRLQKYDRRGTIIDLGFGFYKGDKVLAELKQIYFASLKRFIQAPALRYIEYNMRTKTEAYGELSGDDYDALYRFLKSYLSMSEAAAAHYPELDTTALRLVLQEAVTQTLVSSLQSTRLPPSLEVIVGENIGAYLFYLKRKEMPLLQENQSLVQSARRRLERLPTAQTLYETVIARLADQAPRKTLDELLGRQGEGVLASPKNINLLYSQEGYDQLVSNALTDASKDPLKLDWIVGLTKDRVPESMLDSRQLRADMLNAYIADYRTQWLGFLGSVGMQPFGDLGRSARMLQKLTADQSELAVLLETVAKATSFKQESAVEGAAEKMAENMANKQLKNNKMLSAASKASGVKPSIDMDFSLGKKSPLDELNSTFDALRTFARSTGGSLSGYEGYRDKLKSLGEQLAGIETQGKETAVAVFNGRESDPLLASWKYTQAVVGGMPPELGTALKGVLMSPIEYTGTAASATLSATLNTRWQNEIVKPFTSRLSGRYPLVRKGDEASFNDVMEFFRPSTGTFWGFYDRLLSSFIVKSTDGWGVRTLGSLTLTFNPDLAKTLTGAERIRDIFFKSDGTVRPMQITVTPMSTNKNASKLDVNGLSYDLPLSGKSIQLSWPTDGQPAGATLKIAVGGNYSEDIAYNGQWGFMKLLQAARVSKLNASTINARWQVNVQNTYMVQQEYKIQVSGNDHPFGDPIFNEFNCPTDLMVKTAVAEGEVGK